MIRAHVVVAAPFADYAANSGRFQLVASAFDRSQNRWRESVAAHLLAVDSALCSALIEGTVEAGVPVAVAEFEVMIAHSDEIRSAVNRIVRCTQNFFLLSDDEFELTKYHVMAEMEVQAADPAGCVDRALASVMQFGDVPRIGDHLRDVTATTAVEFRRTMSSMFELGNISWDYETSAAEYFPSFDLVSATML